MRNNSLIVNMFVIILLSILLITSLFSIFAPIDFMGISSWLSPIELIGSCLAVLMITYWSIQFLKKHPNFIQILQRILLIILIGIQIYIAFNFVDYGRADSFYIHNQAVLLAHASYHWMNYFNIYPNNVFCAVWISELIKLSILLHLKSPWILINLIQFIWLDLGLIACLLLLHKWNKSYLKPLLIFIWIITAPFYGYVLFVYTDIWVLPVPVMIAALLEMHFPTKISLLKFILISGLLLLAAKMKGNFWILVIAVMLGIIISEISRHHFNQFPKLLWTFILLFLVFSIGMKGIQKATNYSSTNQALPVTHWIAMSSNPNTHGDYLKRETLDEIALPTKKARTQTDIKLITNNLKQMKLPGLIQHCALKLQLLTSSGTFGFERLTKQWQQAPQWFYHYQTQLKIRLANITQIEYIILLCGTIILLLWSSIDESQLILVIFMIGIIIFHSVLWESEERYGLPLLPILILFGILGIDTLVSRTKDLSHSQLHIGKGFLTVIFIILIGEVIADLPLNSSGYITGQNIGSYLADEQIVLMPHKTLTTGIKLPIKAHKLELLPLGYNQKIKATISQENHLVAKVNSTAQLKKINISHAHAGELQVKIYNPTRVPINFAVGKAAYPIASVPIKNHSQTYLQYQLEQ